MGGIARVAADLHLTPAAPERTRRFLRFLADSQQQRHSVFLLGDIFDIWYGDDDPSPFADEIRAALYATTTAGCAVFLQRGNRDFMLGRRFMQQTHCTLLPDEFALVWGEHRYLLTHGDLLVDDAVYVAVRPWLRGLCRALGVALPFAGKQWVAHHLRRASRGRQNVYRLAHRRMLDGLRRHHCTTLIHGHTHQPAHSTLADAGAEFAVWTLADWTRDDATYLQLQDGRVTAVAVPA